MLLNMTCSDNFYTLSNENFVKPLFIALASVSACSSTGLLYCMTSRVECEENGIKFLLSVPWDFDWTFSSKDVLVSFLAGGLVYFAKTYYKAVLHNLPRIRLPTLQVPECLLFRTKCKKKLAAVDVVFQQGSRNTPRWPAQCGRPLTFLQNVVGLPRSNNESTTSSLTEDAKDSPLPLAMQDSPTPIPRKMENVERTPEAKGRFLTLEKKKKTLERRLKSEAKFHSLQERLRELLAMDPSKADEGDKESGFREPMLKSRKTMLKLHERLEEIENEMARCQ